MEPKNKTPDPQLEAVTAMAKTVEAHETAIAALKANGEDTTAIETRVKGLEADLDKLKKSGNRLGLSGLADEKKKFNLGAIVKAYADGKAPAILSAFEKASDSEGSLGHEGEVLTQFSKQQGRGVTVKDVVSALTGASGGAVLPMEVESITAAAREKAKVFSLGAENPQYEGFSQVTLPRETSIMVPAGVGEGRALPLSAPLFEPDVMSPHRVGFICGFTDEILRMGGNVIQQHVDKYGPIDLANMIDNLILNGNGKGGQEGQPLGLFSTTRLAKYTTTTLRDGVGTNGRNIAWADLKAMEVAIDNALRLEDATKPGYLISRKLTLALTTAYAALASGTDSTNSLPIVPNLQYAKLEKIMDFLGYALARTSYVPTNFVQGSTTTATAAMFGDWSKVVVPFWGPSEVNISDTATVSGVSAFQNCLVFMRFYRMFDVGVRTHDAFTVVKGFTY